MESNGSGSSRNLSNSSSQLGRKRRQKAPAIFLHIVGQRVNDLTSMRQCSLQVVKTAVSEVSCQESICAQTSNHVLREGSLKTRWEKRLHVRKHSKGCQFGNTDGFDVARAN